jgi:hypothetical protein
VLGTTAGTGALFQGWLNTQLVWASQEPWTFLYYILLLLSPFFCISAYLSWKLSQQIEKQRRKRSERKKEN